MRQTQTGRRLAGAAIAGLLVAGTASAANEALIYYPTSVAPTLPSPETVEAMQDAAPRGFLATLRSAHRRAVGQGWAGIPALDRVPPGETAAAVARGSVEQGASATASAADARPARSAPEDAGVAE